jgi:two-component system, chemotaxis family, sensor kinase CheA
MEETKDHLDEESLEHMAARLRELFREEAYELIAELESAVLEIERTPEDREQIGRVFRAMHTIKGSGAVCGLDDIVSFTHEIETFYDLVRKGNISLNREIIDLTLAARDQIKAMLDKCYYEGTTDEAKGRRIIEAFKNSIAGTEAARKDALPLGEEAQAGCRVRPAPEKEQTYRIRFHPSQAMVGGGMDPSELLNELAELGTCAVVAKMDAHSSPTGAPCWEVLLVTRWGIDAIQDVFILTKDQWELTIEVSDGQDREKNETTTTTDEAQRSSGVDAPGTNAAPASPKQGQEVPFGSLHGGAPSSIRVATNKLDTLVDLVGELVTIQARLSLTALSRGLPEFISIAEEVERLTGNLRDEAMSIRMMPIGATFSRFKRLVRDLAQELGKEVELVTEGAETELDKTVIERLGDPLMHLIRNSIDHGIESPETRTRAGKPRAGTVVLSAAHSGAHVLIQVRDDGSGFDLETIRAKGVERGLVREGEGLSEKELLSLICMPGFSTAKTVTSISGRGVGLDVVKRSLDSLGGTLMIRNNEGAGTTLVLKLPLTLAIIDGFLTEVGAERYIFPLSMVEECVELTTTGSATGNGKHMINVRGQIVPYVRLREQFAITGTPPSIEQVVIARVDDKRVGFVVDHVVGGHQTVIKNLGTFYRDVEGLSGATILGDGTVALILDVPRIIQLAEQEEVAMCRGKG